MGLSLVARPLAELMIGQDLRAAAALVTPWIAASSFLSGMIAYYFGFGFTLGKKTGLLLVTMAIPALCRRIARASPPKPEPMTMAELCDFMKCGLLCGG